MIHVPIDYVAATDVFITRLVGIILLLMIIIVVLLNVHMAPRKARVSWLLSEGVELASKESFPVSSVVTLPDCEFCGNCRSVMTSIGRGNSNIFIGMSPCPKCMSATCLKLYPEQKFYGNKILTIRINESERNTE